MIVSVPARPNVALALIDAQTMKAKHSQDKGETHQWIIAYLHRGLILPLTRHTRNDSGHLV